jgi:hypothetical protein
MPHVPLAFHGGNTPEDLWWRTASVADVQRAGLAGDGVPPVRVEAAFVPWASLHAAERSISRRSTI